MGNELLNSRTIAEQIFLAGVESVMPDRLITGIMHLKDSCLEINDLRFSLESVEHIYVIGAGKASAMMGAEVEKVLGELISEGHIVVKYGHACKLKYIDVTEAGHPVPDDNGFKATSEILRIAGMASTDDLVICLLSGGGSSLLPDISEGCSANDKG